MALAALAVTKWPMKSDFGFLPGGFRMAGQTERPFVSPHQTRQLRSVGLVAQQTFSLASRGMGHHRALALAVTGQADRLFPTLNQGLSRRGMTTMTGQTISILTGGMFRDLLGLAHLRMAGLTDLGRRLGQHRHEFAAVGRMATKAFPFAKGGMNLVRTVIVFLVAVKTEGVGIFFYRNGGGAVAMLTLTSGHGLMHLCLQ